MRNFEMNRRAIPIADVALRQAKAHGARVAVFGANASVDLSYGYEINTFNYPGKTNLTAIARAIAGLKCASRVTRSPNRTHRPWSGRHKLTDLSMRPRWFRVIGARSVLCIY